MTLGSIPGVLFNYLTAQKDIADWRACIRLTREILGQSAMDRFRGEEIAPGKEVQTDAQVDAWVRQSVESAYHLMHLQEWVPRMILLRCWMSTVAYAG